MRKFIEQLNNNKGFTLIELLVSVTILAITSGFLINYFITASDNNFRASVNEEVNIRGQQILEDIKAIGYDKLINDWFDDNSFVLDDEAEALTYKKTSGNYKTEVIIEEYEPSEPEYSNVNYPITLIPEFNSNYYFTLAAELQKYDKGITEVIKAYWEKQARQQALDAMSAYTSTNGLIIEIPAFNIEDITKTTNFEILSVSGNLDSGTMTIRSRYSMSYAPSSSVLISYSFNYKDSNGVWKERVGTYSAGSVDFAGNDLVIEKPNDGDNRIYFYYTPLNLNDKLVFDTRNLDELNDYFKIYIFEQGTSGVSKMKLTNFTINDRQMNNSTWSTGLKHFIVTGSNAVLKTDCGTDNTHKDEAVYELSDNINWLYKVTVRVSCTLPKFKSVKATFVTGKEGVYDY